MSNNEICYKGGVATCSKECGDCTTKQLNFSSESPGTQGSKKTWKQRFLNMQTREEETLDNILVDQGSTEIKKEKERKKDGWIRGLFPQDKYNAIVNIFNRDVFLSNFKSQFEDLGQLA